ncbi:hypothetical protein HY604_02105 [Candidatus Peregrinibacteria bacterium]|nr:hypothetical protein [Candidatus Peregrinibacteria bacterium]
MRGKFITLYGINNIGKTTQAKRLVEKLRGYGLKAEYIKYPIYDLAPTGPLLNDVLRSGEQKISEDELQMWFVMNRYQFQPKLISMLEDGVNVVAEDYIGTGVAWGMAKGLEEDFLECINGKLIKEGLAILMEGVRDVAAIENLHVHEKNEALTEKCREIFANLGEKYCWKKVLVDKNWDITTDRLWEVVKESLQIS